MGQNRLFAVLVLSGIIATTLACRPQSTGARTESSFSLNSAANSGATPSPSPAPNASPFPGPTPGAPLRTTALDWKWQDGTTTPDEGTAIAVDQSRNVYIAGAVRGGLWGTDSSAGIALAKLDPGANLLWKKSYGNAYSHANDIAIDSNGNAVVVGTLYYDDFIGPKAGLNDAFVMKVAPDGTIIWKKRHGTAGEDYGLSVALDPSGNIAVAVATYIWGDDASKVAPGGSAIAKYNSSGDLLWTKSFGADRVFGVAADASGNFYLSGTQDWESSNGRGKANVRKLSPAGDVIWNRQHGASAEGWLTGVDASGNVYLLGNRIGIPSTAFLVKMDASGNTLWNRSAPRLLMSPRALVVHADGSAYFAYAQNNGTEAGGEVYRFNPDGTLEWTYSFIDSTSKFIPYGMALDSDRNAYVSGMALGDFARPQIGNFDFGAMKLAP